MSKFWWNSNQNTILFIQENPLKMSSAKWQPFCLSLYVKQSRCPHPPLLVKQSVSPTNFACDDWPSSCGIKATTDKPISHQTTGLTKTTPKLITDPNPTEVSDSDNSLVLCNKHVTNMPSSSLMTYFHKLVWSWLRNAVVYENMLTFNESILICDLKCWKWIVFMMPTLWSMAALQIFIMTSYYATSVHKAGIMTILSFQWNLLQVLHV